MKNSTEMSDKFVQNYKFCHKFITDKLSGLNVLNNKHHTLQLLAVGFLRKSNIKSIGMFGKFKFFKFSGFPDRNRM